MSDVTRQSESTSPGDLQLQRLDIVDAEGRTRIVLGSIGPDPVPGFTLYNEAGEERVTLALYDTGPQLSFVLGGFGVLEIGVADPDHPEVGTPGAFLYLIEYEGDTVYGWQAGDPSWRPRSQR